MDYQFIMNVAQIITGLATLLVAFVLLYQLRQQHRDAQREIVLAINEQRQSLAISLADNHELSLHVDPDFALKVNLALFPGRRKFYRESIMRYTLPETFVNKIDKYITEIEEKVGEEGQDTSLLMDRINENKQ